MHAFHSLGKDSQRLKSAALILIALFALPAMNLCADEPRVSKIREGVYSVGKVEVYKDKGFIKVPGKVNQRGGLIELLAASPIGKLHESVLVIEAEPLDIQVGLILIGLRGADPSQKQEFGNYKPLGDPVDIRV